ncbi:MAG: CoA transferase [Chloroflexi bacterium]|nr:CoA transferase [Chloroflexota bacterium]
MNSDKTNSEGGRTNGNGAIGGLSPLPLSGIRVLELAEGWAGPMSGMWLGDLGAEVIKVEAIQRYDHARGPVEAPEGLTSYPDKKPGPRPYDVSAPYVQANRNKLAITIDLSRPQGVALFKRLVALTDVVVTNMVTGVPEKMGIAYRDLVKVRSDLIMLISSGYGATGPYSRRVTMGGAMDGIAGYTWLRHYADQTPDTITYSTHTDVVTGMNNSLSVLMAIYHRAVTGRGQLIETSGVEASIQQVHGSLMDYALNGRVHTSPGNDHPFMAPHGCYRCKGDDRWINITVSSERQWQALCRTMGKPAWSREPRFSTQAGRWADRGELNQLIERWTQSHDRIELMHRLQKAGVPAGAVYDQADAAHDPHWKARGAYQTVVLADGKSYPIATPPWTMDGRRLAVRRPPPAFGQHNQYVLGEVLGLGDDEIARLQAEQYIGDAPLGAASSGPLSNRDQTVRPSPRG